MSDEVFSEENYSQALDLIKRFSLLIPSDKSKIDYLNTILNYVDGIINGDAIHQYVTYESISSLAKQAFKEIMDDVHENVLNSYNVEKMNLQEEVSTLTTSRNNLSSQVQDLEDTKLSLIKETSTLSIELEKLKDKLKALREDSLCKLQEEINCERKRLKSEISSLTEEKNTLNTTISELKAIVNNYNLSITTSLDSFEEVNWVPISKDDPIYNTNYKTIDGYISSLKTQYMERTHVSTEKCEKEFNKFCPNLNQFVELLKNFNNCSISATSSLRAIIEYDNWNAQSNHKKDLLISMLKNFRMPEYFRMSKHQNKSVNIDTTGLRVDTTPTNINVMLRELYFQRVLAEASAKQRILERELEIVVSILKDVLPVDYDLTSHIYGFDDLLGMLKDNDEILKLEQN